jgi:hypothetical protein
LEAFANVGYGLEIAPAGKPGCYGEDVNPDIAYTQNPVAARLAGGGGRKIADAGEPDCYGRSLGLTA